MYLYVMHKTPSLYTRDNPQNTNITGEARNGSILHITNVLRSRLSPPVLVYLEDYVVTFLHVVGTHQLINSLFKNQFCSKKQLVPFYKQVLYFTNTTQN